MSRMRTSIVSIAKATSDLTPKQINQLIVQKLRVHPLCRPPRGARPIRSDYANVAWLWRLGGDGIWRVDNGQPGLAFVGELKSEPIVWHAKCSCPYPLGCAAGAASSFAVSELDLPTLRFERRPKTR